MDRLVEQGGRRTRTRSTGSEPQSRSAWSACDPSHNAAARLRFMLYPVSPPKTPSTQGPVSVYRHPATSLSLQTPNTQRPVFLYTQRPVSLYRHPTHSDQSPLYRQRPVSPLQTPNTQRPVFLYPQRPVSPLQTPNTQRPVSIYRHTVTSLSLQIQRPVSNYRPTATSLQLQTHSDQSSLTDTHRPGL